MCICNAGPRESSYVVYVHTAGIFGVVSASVSQVFSCFLGDASATLKSAARLARLLEEQFIADGWPSGRIYGSEIELARRHRIGRGVVREALRVLEARGTARTRCGRNGGLELIAPPLEQLYERIADYCFLSGVSRAQILVLQNVLRRVAERIAAEHRTHNAVIALYENCAQWLSSADQARASSDEHRTCAEKIVHALRHGVGRERWAGGYFVGNQQELCHRYNVDQRALRQAIRILESAEAAESMPGRGNGLMTRLPGPVAISRLICCYFAASGIDHHQAFEAFHWLSSETMALAALHADAHSVAPISGMLTQMEGLADTALLPALAAIEHRQFALAGNKLLDLFLLSARAFPSWSPFSTMSTAPGGLSDLRECAAQVNAAIAAGDAPAAALAQDLKSAAIRRNLERSTSNIRLAPLKSD